MSDLVERLRMEGAYIHPTSEVFHAAANEIERKDAAIAELKAEIVSLNKAYNQPVPLSEWQKMEAAIAELVVALTGLMTHESRSRIMPTGSEWDAARTAIAKHYIPKDGL